MRLNIWPHHCDWSASRNVRAGFSGTHSQTVGDLQQLLLALRICFLCGQFSRELRITPGPGRHGVAGHDDCFEERLLVDDVTRARKARPASPGPPRGSP